MFNLWLRVCQLIKWVIVSQIIILCGSKRKYVESGSRVWKLIMRDKLLESWFVPGEPVINTSFVKFKSPQIIYKGKTLDVYTSSCNLPTLYWNESLTQRKWWNLIERKNPSPNPIGNLDLYPNGERKRKRENTVKIRTLSDSTNSEKGRLNV